MSRGLMTISGLDSAQWLSTSGLWVGRMLSLGRSARAKSWGILGLTFRIWALSFNPEF